MFSVSPAIDTDALEKIFRHMVLKMLLAKGKISPDVIALLDKWRHMGNNAFLRPKTRFLLEMYGKGQETLHYMPRYIWLRGQ